MPPETTTGAPYDAFYILAYAVAALGDEPVTGPRPRPRHRPPPPAGRPGRGRARRASTRRSHALASGRNVDLGGTATTLDFDPETGDATADFAVYCLGPGGTATCATSIESGLVYRARTRKLTGALRCR